MRSNEVISRSQFFKKAAKELLADGQPHSYGEIVQYIRAQAKGTCLDGSIESNNVWQSLRSMMQEPIIVSQDANTSSYKKRNYYLVDHAEYLVGVFDNKRNMRSGTAQTVNYALRQGKQITLIHPDTADVTHLV